MKDGWEFVIDPDVRRVLFFFFYLFKNTHFIICPYAMQFNNVDLALQLLDQSSLGKDIDSFRRTKNKLSKALKGSVDSMPACFRVILLCSSLLS